MTRYAESREAEHGAGDVVRAASASNNEAEILLDQGHLERAAELFAEALRVYRAAAYTFGAGVAIMNLGRIAAAAGRFQEAHRRFDEALAEFRGIGAESFVLEANMRRAECFVLEGRYTEAWELATETLTAAELAGEATPRVPLLERVRGYARVQGRKPDEAGAHFEESRRVAEQLGAEYELALTMKALADTGAPQYAGLAQVIFDRLGVVATPHVPLP